MIINWFNLVASALYLYLAIQVLCGATISVSGQVTMYITASVSLLYYSFLFKKED